MTDGIGAGHLFLPLPPLTVIYPLQTSAPSQAAPRGWVVPATDDYSGETSVCWIEGSLCRGETWEEKQRCDGGRGEDGIEEIGVNTVKSSAHPSVVKPSPTQTLSIYHPLHNNAKLDNESLPRGDAPDE